jgi:glycosyltransferase involved in cell wall biosynthesis
MSSMALLNDNQVTTTELKGCVSVIVPVYNEADHVEELIQAVRTSPVQKEIIIVDDGSTDGTRDKLRTIARATGIVLLFHDVNCGKGAAIRTGLRYARGEFVLIQDADLEYDPQDYPKLLAPLREGKSNVVYGMRPDRPERGLRYYLGAKFLTHLTNFLYGCGIHDEATCYKAFRRSTVTKLSLECRRFEFCPEVTAKLCRSGEKIVEVPISYEPRGKDAGKKIRSSDGWIAIWTLLRLRFASKSQILSAATRNEAPFPVSVVPTLDVLSEAADLRVAKSAHAR